MATKENQLTALDKNTVKIVSIPNMESLILGVTIATKINSSKKENREAIKRILIISPNGFTGKSNTRLEHFREELSEVEGISTIDKYYVMSETLVEANQNKEYKPTENWDKLTKLSYRFDTIIITDIEPFIQPSKETTYYDASERLSKVLTLFNMYASKKEKSIVILSNKETAFNKMKHLTAGKDVYEVSTKQASIIVSNEKHIGGDLLQKEEFNLDTKSIANIKKDRTVKIDDILYQTKRTTLDMIQKGNIRSMPRYPTGYIGLDKVLYGGLETGQVVSLISDEEDMATHFVMQMALQSPIYFKPLVINLTMNPRRLKELLNVKATQGGLLNSDKVQILTIDKLVEDGDVGELIEAINYYLKEEDTRVFMIDNDSLLGDKSVNTVSEYTELDNIYKKLQILANKLDILIIMVSIRDIDKSSNGALKMIGTQKAVNNVKTQIVVSSNGNSYVSKQLKPAERLSQNRLAGSKLEAISYKGMEN